jgi:hypothetical protein
MLLYYSTLFNKDDWDPKLVHENDEVKVYLMTNRESLFPTMVPEDTVVTTLFNDFSLRLISVSDGITESLYFYMYKLPDNNMTYEEAIKLLPSELLIDLPTVSQIIPSCQREGSMLVASPLEFFILCSSYWILSVFVYVIWKEKSELNS